MTGTALLVEGDRGWLTRNQLLGDLQDYSRETRLRQTTAFAHGGKVVGSDKRYRRSADGHEIIEMDERGSEISQ